MGSNLRSSQFLAGAIAGSLAASSGCGGRGELISGWADSETGGGAPSFPVGGSPSSTGGAAPAAGGSSAGGSPSVPATGGTAPILPADEFSFLSSARPASSFGPTGLSRFVPGGEPVVIFDAKEISGELTVLFALPPEGQFLDYVVGIEAFLEGEIELLLSLQPGVSGDYSFSSAGEWGRSPFSQLSTTVDAVVRRSDGGLWVLVRWNGAPDEIWNAPPLSLVDSAYEKSSSNLLLTSDEGYRFHGTLADQSAVFSDGRFLIHLGEEGKVTLSPQAQDELIDAVISPASTSLVVIARDGDRFELRHLEDKVVTFSVELSEAPVLESLTWLGDQEIVFEGAEETYSWSPGGVVQVDSVRWEKHKPRGKSLVGDFGIALRIESSEGWSVGFVGDEGVLTCGPIPEQIRTLEPLVYQGVSGVVFDLKDEVDPRWFGSLFFCSPGSQPVDLLEQHDQFGKLLSEPESPWRP